MGIEAGEASEVWDRLHDFGLRLTPIRRDLVRLFAGLDRWTTPQELYEQAERAGLRPGLATVYRLVEALTAAGLCRAYPQPNRSVRYVFCPPYHHHHFICRSCGRVVDLRDCRVDAPDLPFEVEDHVVDFFGLCTDCRSAAPPAGEGG